jgi:predicted transcriptional regulator
MKSNVMNGFEMNEAVDKIENDKLNKKTAPKSKSKPKSNATPEPKSNVIDLTPIIAKLPTDSNVTPATLDKLFNLNDGGKTIRRHLRKHFAETMGHEYKSNWTWTLNDPILNDILSYFATKYVIAK